VHITDSSLVIVEPQSKNVMSGQLAKLLSTSTVRTIHKMLSSIKQVKVGPVIPMLCIRIIVHYINIYSRIVIQLNMYVKIITSSGFKSTILMDFMQGHLRVPFRFGRCLKFPGNTLIYRKLSSSPQALRLRARLDTKWEKKIGAEFMTSVSYRPEVINH
jgi:hypothetical protein